MRLSHPVLSMALAIACLLAVAFPAPAQKDDSPGTAASPAEGSSTSPPEENRQLTVDERIAAVAEAIASVAAEVENAASTAAETEDGPNPRLDFLQQQKLLLERRRSALTRVKDLQEQLAPVEGAPDNPANENGESADEAAPTIQDYDVLLDQREEAERQREVALGTVDAQRESVKRAEARLEAASRERRSAEEGGEASAAVAEQARWKETLAALQQDVAQAQLEGAELEAQLAGKTLERAVARATEGRPHVLFTTEALNEQLSAIEAQRNALSEQLAQLHDLLDTHRQRLERAQIDLAQSGEEGKALASEVVATVERELRATQQGEQYAQQQLENLATEETAWRRRFAIFQPGMPDELRVWLTETNAHLQDIRSDKGVVEPDLRNVLSSTLELQRRLDANDLAGGLRPILASRLAAYERHTGYAREYLAALARQETMLVRLADSLRSRIESQGVDAVYAQARKAAEAAWNYELFSYQDRAYRVAALTSALSTFVFVLLFLLFLRRLIRRWWARVLTRFQGTSRSLVLDLGLTLINNTSRIVVLIVAFWAASWFLPLEWLTENRNGVLILAVYLQIAIYATNWLSRSLNRTKARMLKEDPSSVTAYGLMSFFSRFFIWVVFVLLALVATGFEITPLIAGFGIGGIAIAFALQNILADVFNSVAIVLDKPFVVGDFIIVGDTMGVVEHIGIKTTRIRALEGELVSVSNSDLLGSRIQNYKRMEERRVAFVLGVTYQTPADKLRLIPTIVKDAIEAQENIRFDRAHFQAFGDFSLNFECVYYVLTNDYNIFMDIQQAINLILYERFEKEGIEFAYPTQTLFVQREGGGEQPGKG